jgi:hypothetical protein
MNVCVCVCVWDGILANLGEARSVSVMRTEEMIRLCPFA